MINLLLDNFKIILFLIIRLFLVIFIPVLYASFIISGLLCAAASGAIEYALFLKIFTKDAMNMIIGISKKSEFGLESDIHIYIPLFIAMVLETTKVSLIFLNKSIDSRYKWVFSSIKNLLILVSICCTLIFSFYNMDNHNKNSIRNTHEEKIEKKYDKKKEEVNKKYKGIIKTIMDKSYAKEAELINTLKDDRKYYLNKVNSEMENKVNGEWKGPSYYKYNEKLIEVERKIKDLSVEDKYSDIRSKNLENINEVWNGEIKKIDISYEDEISGIESGEKFLQDSGNDLIVSSLKGISSLYNGFDKSYTYTYDHSNYMVFVILLSIMLTIVIESIVYVVFTTLSIKHSDILIFEDKRSTDQIKRDLEDTHIFEAAKNYINHAYSLLFTAIPIGKLFSLLRRKD